MFFLIRTIHIFLIIDPMVLRFVWSTTKKSQFENFFNTINHTHTHTIHIDSFWFYQWMKMGATEFPNQKKKKNQLILMMILEWMMKEKVDFDYWAGPIFIFFSTSNLNSLFNFCCCFVLFDIRNHCVEKNIVNW